MDLPLQVAENGLLPYKQKSGITPLADQLQIDFYEP